MRIIIDKVAYGGYGIGKVNGKIIFVNYALPGDELEIEIYQEHKNYSFADFEAIIKPSPFRVKSPCPNFEICGGCSYLNLTYPDEIKYKELLVKEQLIRNGIFPLSEIKLTSGPRFHYRSHANIKFINMESGFYARNSNKLVPFTDNGCMLLTNILNEGLMQKGLISGSGEIKISEDKNNSFISYSGHDPERIITEQVGEFIFKHPISGFFQSNRFLRKSMIDIVCMYCDLTEYDEFIDICSGCGFFTIPLSRLSLKGTGFDIDKNSIDFARGNALLNNCSNINFFTVSESDINPVRLNPKTVIVDPPRNGITKKGRNTIKMMEPEIIVYVSCNPSTFARDVSDFNKKGYSLSNITLIDMFPCTHHIELIGKLIRGHIAC